MKGLIRKACLTLGSVGLLAGSLGCYAYQDIVDPCYPERYWHAARQNVYSAFAPQVQNGHVLDQTIWNHHFEAGTDKLAPGGLEQLNYLARRRPQPTATVFIQTAEDIPYDPAKPEEFVRKRQELNTKRGEAVRKYLNSITTARGGSEGYFQVVVHEPGQVGQPADPATRTVQQMHARVRGGLQGTGGTTSGGGSGTSGGSTGQ